MSAQAAAVTGQFLPQGDIGNKTKSIVLLIVVVLVVVIIIVVIKKGMGIFNSVTDGVDSVLETIGIRDSEADKKAKADADAINTKANAITSPFNPAYYKTVPAGTTLFTQAKADQLAEQIYDSVGILYDDPESGLAAIKQARNWAQVSQIADSFNTQFNKDVFAWLYIKYDTTAQKAILAKLGEYAFNLPKT